MISTEFATIRTRTPRRREYPRVWLNESTTITNGQLLALNNAIEDLRHEVQRHQDRIATLERNDRQNEAALTNHEEMMARHDDRIVACEQTLELAHHEPTAFGRGSQPDPSGLPSPVRTMADEAVDPRMVVLNVAISHLIAGALIAQKCGITGGALRDYVWNATNIAELRYQKELAH